MSAVEERVKAPDACEQFGQAVNSKNLACGEFSWAADRIGDVGRASVVMREAAAIKLVWGRAQQADIEMIEADLAPLLWRLKAGGEVGFAAIVGQLFAHWLVARGKFVVDEEAWVIPFAKRAVHELLNLRCQACRGCGQQEKVGNAWCAPRGLKMLTPKFRTCLVCGGGGLGKPRHHERANALGITMKDYERDGWARRFRAAQVWLDKISRRLYKPLAILKRRE